MGWCACSRKCTRCLGSRGGDADGWSASASTLCIPWQSHSSKALPRFLGDVYTCVVGAKSWQAAGVLPCNADGNLFRFGFLSLRQGDNQQAVCVLGLHLLMLHVDGEGHGAQ